jgi:hypothetical protein
VLLGSDLLLTSDGKTDTTSLTPEDEDLVEAALGSLRPAVTGEKCEKELLKDSRCLMFVPSRGVDD